VTDGKAHRVVIVGGGFGGLPAARILARKKDVQVTLVDRRNHHLFQPLLYQVATGMIPAGQISQPLRHILRKHDNVRVELAEVTGFDLDARLVHLNLFGLAQRDIPYDSLIVSAGVGQSYFGNDSFALYAPGMKTVDDAMELKRRVFGAFEVAEMTDDPDEKKRWLTFAIVGAGPTGVELAGQVRELATRSLRGEFRTFDASDARVILLDGAKTPLATFGDQLAGKATKMLEGMGIELQMNSRVVHVDFSGVDLLDADGNKSHLAAHTTVWAAGVEASPLAAALAKASGAETDRAGRIMVLPDLTLPGHPEVFAIGDMASVNNLPGVAEVALQGGAHAANTIKRRLNGKESVPFKYRDLGSVATIGRFKAIVSVHGVTAVQRAAHRRRPQPPRSRRRPGATQPHPRPRRSDSRQAGTRQRAEVAARSRRPDPASRPGPRGHARLSGVIHARVVSPPDVTELLMPGLVADPGIFNLTIGPGSVRNPDGDAIQFDMVQSTANEVVARMRELGLDQRGSIVLEPVTTEISATAAQATTARWRFDEFAPVWEEIDARIRSGGRYPPSWFVLLVIAGLIAAVGLLTNSQILIVGAMVVGPEYGAIVAGAYGVMRREHDLVARSAVALALGFVLAIVAALLLGLMVRAAGLEPKAFELGIRPVSHLINTPDWFSFIVAVLAGVVGVVSLTEARASTLIGVFISVTTIPAAADLGVSTAFGSGSEALGSLEQLLLNIFVLGAVAIGGIPAQRAVWRRLNRPAGVTPTR
jgi:NADH dehydrogenase